VLTYPRPPSSGIQATLPIALLVLRRGADLRGDPQPPVGNDSRHETGLIARVASGDRVARAGAHVTLSMSPTSFLCRPAALNRGRSAVAELRDHSGRCISCCCSSWSRHPRNDGVCVSRARVGMIVVAIVDAGRDTDPPSRELSDRRCAAVLSVAADSSVAFGVRRAGGDVVDLRRHKAHCVSGFTGRDIAGTSLLTR